MINIGDEVKDTITGFTGIAVCRCDWLNGCVRFVVQGQKLHEGKVTEPATFDVQQLKLIKAKAIKDNPAPSGGPRPDPVRR